MPVHKILASFAFGRASLSSGLCCFLALALSGCLSVSPKPLRSEDIAREAERGLAAAHEGVPQVGATLSLEEAIARSLKYNLDQRVARLEQAFALNIWEKGNYDMLPQVVASAGYAARSNELITRSRDSVTGDPSLANPYISSEKSAATYDLGLSWSVLDFTMGYYQSKQNADRVLIAAEQRRRAVHALVRDVTVAYWRMVSAQELLERVRATTAEAESALLDAQRLEQEGLNPPLDNLRYRRQILENIRLLSDIQKEFASARVELATLANLPLNASFEVVEPEWDNELEILERPVDQLETLALMNNAELRQGIYEERISRQETRMALARLFPNLGLDAGYTHSSDDFLINQNWAHASSVLSQNLTSLLALPSSRRLAKNGVELSFQRRVASQMALLAQVHIARLEFYSRQRQLELAEEIWALDQSIQELARSREAAESDSRLSRVATDVASIVSMLRRYQAVADFNASVGALQSSLGLEIEIGSVDQATLQELTEAVRQWRRNWQELGSAPGPDSEVQS